MIIDKFAIDKIIFNIPKCKIYFYLILKNQNINTITIFPNIASDSIIEKATTAIKIFFKINYFYFYSFSILFIYVIEIYFILGSEFYNYVI